MTTLNKPQGNTYSLVTTEESFTAQNVSSHMQEWVRTSSPPPESLSGLIRGYGEGLTGAQGSGSLYARGKGMVVVIT